MVPASFHDFFNGCASVAGADRARGAGRGVHEHVHQQIVDGAAQQFLIADRDQVPAQPAHDLEPVDVGQQDIEDQQVEGAVTGQAERIRPVSRGGHVEAEEAQRGGDGVPEEQLVVYHEQVPVVGWHHKIAAYGGERYVRGFFKFRVNAAVPGRACGPGSGD